MASSLLLVASNRLLRSWLERLMTGIESRMWGAS